MRSSADETHVRSGRNSLRRSGKKQWEQRETGSKAAGVAVHRQEGGDGAQAAPTRGGGRREMGWSDNAQARVRLAARKLGHAF
ncbi:hypothetical protein D7S81_27140 [Ralstonia insidiosa]|nr:hypothetical protein [Ralstonia insidiosa]MBA9940279.1 hypothetical protein [Ralstonia insidiosa]